MRNHLGILFIVFFAFPISAYAALININTADAALLDTLPGIGPSKAIAIVDYRTQNGLFARIEDIQNVSGIGPSTYAGIEPFITVSDTGVSGVPDSSAAASSTPDAPAPSSGGATTYTPPPPVLSVTISGLQNATLEVPLRLSARVTMKSGAVDPSARIAWSFGDGSSNEGTVVEKTYHYAGTYLVTATAADGDTNARGELVVMVAPARVRLLPASSEGVTVANDSSERLDLSGWRVLSGAGSFRIPSGTTLLPESSALFPFSIMNLPVTSDAALVYPDGVIAAHSAPTVSVAEDVAPAPLADEQLSNSAGSSYEVQTVGYTTTSPVIDTSVSGTAYDEAVRAPTATAEPAAVGAVPSAGTVASNRFSNLFRSPWTAGLLGVILTAGGAFILL